MSTFFCTLHGSLLSLLSPFDNRVDKYEYDEWTRLECLPLRGSVEDWGTILQIWKIEGGRCVRLTTSPWSFNRSSRQCGKLDDTKTVWAPRPVTWIALSFLTYLFMYINIYIYIYIYPKRQTSSGAHPVYYKINNVSCFHEVIEAAALG
jgi:hypothetical protein